MKNSGLFAPLLDLSCSEAGVFGTIDAEEQFMVLQFDTSANQLSIKEKFSVKKPKSTETEISGLEKTLIIGNNFYLLRNGKFVHAINMVSQGTFPVQNSIEIPMIEQNLQDFLSYNPREQAIEMEGSNFIRRIKLQFSPNPLITTEISTTTTTVLKPSTTISSTTVSGKKIIGKNKKTDLRRIFHSLLPSWDLPSYTFYLEFELCTRGQ